MRNLLLLALLVLVVTGAQAQQSETRSVGTFKGVKASTGIDVYLKKGPKESVRVEVSGVALSEIITDVEGTWLKIRMSRGEYHDKKTVKVYVTYVAIEKLTASSAANIFSEGTIKTDQMEIVASSAASIEVNIDVNSVKVESASAADVVLEGKTVSLTAESASAGVIDAYKLDAENVTVSTASAGEAKVSVTKALVANSVSAGSIHYRGNPSKTMTNANSGGSVKKSN